MVICAFLMALASPSLSGSWAGAFVDGARSLYATFIFAASSAGSISATVAYPTEGAEFFPVTSASFEGGRLHIELMKGGESVRLDGSLDGDRITGSYRYGNTEGSLENHKKI
jgi:hypothetical protein